MWFQLLPFLCFAHLLEADFVHSRDASVEPITPTQNDEIQNNCGRIGGNSKTGINKIDFGDLARPGQFPWAAAMEHRLANGTMERLCSATLISSRHALTAAHCVLRLDMCTNCGYDNRKNNTLSNVEKTSDPSGWTIAYGGHCDTVGAEILDESCQKDNMKRVGVRAIAWDERYINICSQFDMAIVEFERDVEFDFEHGSTIPICLADPSFDFNATTATFFGFGVVAQDNDATIHTLHSQLRYGMARHTYTKMDGGEMFLDKRLNETEAEQLYAPYQPRVAFASGDSGGGVFTTSCDGTNVLIGAVARSASNTTQSYASVLRSHIDQICTLTGVCPIDRCN